MPFRSFFFYSLNYLHLRGEICDNACPLNDSLCSFMHTPTFVQIIFGNRWRLLIGERDFWEHIGGIDICLDPASFGQANTLVNIKLCKMCFLYSAKRIKIKSCHILYHNADTHAI